MDRKIKLLAILDAVTRTGFSRVGEGILTNLPQEDYDISVLGVNYFGDPHNLPYRVYPAMTPMAVQTGDVQGFNRVQEIIAKEMPDIIFVLNDIWVINRHLEIFAETFKAGRPKIVTYFPIDARFHNPQWYKGIDQGWVDEAVVYTQFGKEVASLACPSFEFKVIPHGVDTKTFFKLPGSKTMIKKALFPQEPTFYEDSFVVLNANRNQPRKKWWLTLEAFKLFAEGKPENVRLHVHAGVQDSDMNIENYAHRLGILDRITATSKKIGPQQVPDAKLNHIYNACDVGLNTCYVAGTKVLTKAGYKNIEEIQKDDVVFSHTGKESIVTNTFSYDYSGETLKITPFGSFPIQLTPNHKLFADSIPYLKLLRTYKNDVRNNPNLRFVRSDELLEGSILTFPVIKKETNTIGIEKAFLYGAYLAEGCKGSGGIVFSLNSQSSDDFLREKIINYMKFVYNLDAHIVNNTRNRQTITFYSMKVQREFQEIFGNGAHNKRIPEELLYLPKEEKISMLKAYFLGDGHLSDKSKSLSFVTVSESLANSVWFILTTLGYIAPTLRQKTRGEWVVSTNGESAFELARLFDLSLTKTHDQNRSKMWADNEYLYFTISKIEHVNYENKIYDLEVEGEHSYITHISGHNSVGEGWGLPNFEHGATGAPQVVPDHSANHEIYWDCGLLVPPVMDYTLSEMGTKGAICKAEDIAERLEWLYTDKGLYESLSTRIYAKCTLPEYQWKNISLRWDTLFKETLSK